jgi:phosphatidylserine/phosphatidylglycerophosphate/cardiolipin synthase-like enzyme
MPNTDKSLMETFTLGTGASIYTQRLLPAILLAQHEIILVTCFWAPSKTLTALSNALEQLARKRETQQPPQPLRVRICFSSRSLLQKLSHTSSTDGYVYPSSAWSRDLGLPAPEVLAAGRMELDVKSLFFLPFGVMHPKFLIVDRRRAFVPSCNVSWEAWLEGCLEISRRLPRDDPIDGLLGFYRIVWHKDLDLEEPLPSFPEYCTRGASVANVNEESRVQSPADIAVRLMDVQVPAAAVKWLPSWHHRNPSFCLWPWKSPSVPDTPLNITILKLFDEASREIYIQTPNLTSPPVLSAINKALTRGVDVTIVTSRRMMLLEQIITAGTTTGWCIRGLVKRYRRLCNSARKQVLAQAEAGEPVDLEAQAVAPGSFQISYFRSRAGSTSAEEPVHSHLKLSIFDGQHTVLGSGNMDRASWFTSQELGVLIQSVDFATTVRKTVDEVLDGRFDSILTTS